MWKPRLVELIDDNLVQGSVLQDHKFLFGFIFSNTKLGIEIGLAMVQKTKPLAKVFH